MDNKQPTQDGVVRIDGYTVLGLSALATFAVIALGDVMTVGCRCDASEELTFSTTRS
ncbi:hypothetical protein [Halomonas sp. DQ26W]|uniref:hypothetical protein n=1 Tax=Halomonas sp. DQ26W TaxID=2282311 RepID=UPI0015F002A5|nr:hypothetical protein [Halomonas sp. DQ26W]